MPQLVSTAQITITDQSDYIFTGNTPPSNPIAGLTLWVDTSVSPNQLKRWTGSSWEVVNKVEVGGTNLLPNSSFEDRFNYWTTHGSAVAQWSASGYNGGYCLYIPGSGYSNVGIYIPSFMCETGQSYTFSCMAKVEKVGSRVVLGWKDSSVSAIQQQLASMPLNVWRKVQITFTGDGSTAPIYLISSGYNLYIDHVKLEKGNMATDWSPAPGDFSNLLSDIANDNKFTPDEKQSTLREWQSIQNEISSLRTQADNFKVSRTVYDATYATLHSYITPLLSSLTTTSDIVGTTFRTRFNDYYTARTNLLLAISQQQKDNFDNLIVGGENLYNDTCGLSVWSPGGSTPTITRNTVNSPNGFEFVSSDGGNGVNVRISNVVKSNGYHVVSFLAKVTSGSHSFSVDLADNQVGSFMLNTNWQKIEATANVQNHTADIYNFVDIATSGYVTCYIKDFQVQKGNKSTEYNKSTELITKAIQGSTDIDGGLVATHLLMLKNSGNSVTGGLSGLSSDNIGYWSGGSYNEALTGIAKSIIRKDGSGHFAAGNFNWDTIGNIALKGFIDAIGGRIGGLTIQQNSLSSTGIRFSDSPVESLNSLLTPSTASFYYQSSWNVELQSQTACAYTQQLYLTFEASISFVASTYSDGNDQRWRVEITGNDGSVAYLDSGMGVLNQKLYTVSLGVGSYVVSVYSMSVANFQQIVTNAAIISGSPTSNIIQATGYVSQTKVGNNGLYSFWSNQLYLYFSSLAGFELKGPTNMPGVLASGSISSTGAQSNSWGAKKNSSNASYTATGIYDVPHLAGSIYQVMIQPTTDNVRASVTSKGNNTFRVQLRTNSGTATVGNFDYVIFGSN